MSRCRRHKTNCALETTPTQGALATEHMVRGDTTWRGRGAARVDVPQAEPRQVLSPSYLCICFSAGPSEVGIVICSTDVETEAWRHAECFTVYSSLILTEGSRSDDSFGSAFSDSPCALGKRQRQDLSSGCCNWCVLRLTSGLGLYFAAYWSY